MVAVIKASIHPDTAIIRRPSPGLGPASHQYPAGGCKRQNCYRLDRQGCASAPPVSVTRDGLTVTGGDVLDLAAVAAVISGVDAVLSAVGPRIRDNFR
jgi:hypothetical protein